MDIENNLKDTTGITDGCSEITGRDNRSFLRTGRLSIDNTKSKQYPLDGFKSMVLVHWLIKFINTK